MPAPAVLMQTAGAPPAPGGEIGRTADGRLHLTHGPIGVIIDIKGTPAHVERAERNAVAAFSGLLEALVEELDHLRAPYRPGREFRGSVAQRMAGAVSSFGTRFITPMAAVAGAVADHLMAAIRDEPGLRRAVVNNGGDIAIWLAEGESIKIGISDYCNRDRRAATIRIRAEDRIGGIATSGWRGRSHSLGIADAVTVLARTAAAADAAATIIANEVDLSGSEQVRRQPARDLAPDSDLGDRLVTVAVGDLSASDKALALDAGARQAEDLIAVGTISAAFLVLQDEKRMVGPRTNPGGVITGTED